MDMTAKEKDYIAHIREGSLVAFRILADDEKLISGKVQRVNSDDTVDIQTKNGNNYVIPKTYIAWVNTNGRWPKGVMEAFKIARTDVVEE